MFGPHACRLTVVPGVFVLTVFAPWWAPVLYGAVTLAVIRRLEPSLAAGQRDRAARATAVTDALTAARHTNLTDLRAAIEAARELPATRTPE